MIPFTKPTLIGNEIASLEQIISSGSLESSISYVCDYLEEQTKINSAYFCNSCSDALEISALAMDLKEGDEIIVPDYTFVTSASSFALRGAKIVFCDIETTDICLNLDMAEKLITEKTKAIVWVDYAGSSQGVKKAREICDKHNLFLVQDAAQSIGNWFYAPHQECLQGDFITYSFHSTKNINSGGEGGALLVRNESFIEIVDMIFEKGTNRRSFIRNEVDKYTWRTLGSSFAGSYSQAALLLPQLKELEEITSSRRSLWRKYLEGLVDSIAFQKEWIIPSAENIANAHMFWILAPSKDLKDSLLDFCNSHNIQLASHYQSLAKSPAGKIYGSSPLGVNTSERVSECLVRLPLWHGMSMENIQHILDVLNKFYNFSD